MRATLWMMVLGCGALALSACSDPGEVGEPAGPAIDSGTQAAASGDPVLAHGKYLVDNVLLCYNCHSERDWSLYSGPIVEGSEGRGGVVGLFGDQTWSPDITPEALVDWSVEDVVASIVDGRDLEGNELHAAWGMPMLSILTSDDALAVARYIKAPGKAAVVAQNRSVENGPARGSYLVAIGRCVLCHDRDLSGGMEVATPSPTSLLSANITIDTETGVGRMTRTEFVDFFKSLSGPEFARLDLPPNTANTSMAWPQFSQMSRQDLGSIYDYLETRPGVSKVVPVH